MSEINNKMLQLRNNLQNEIKVKTETPTIAELLKFINVTDIRPVVVNNEADCIKVIAELRVHLEEYKVLGFDCESKPTFYKNQYRNPVALLQLASSKGLCALIRLNSLKRIPQELNDLLSDEKILKVGVETEKDANYLHLDYDLTTKNTLDLRYLAYLVHIEPLGLNNMYKNVFGSELKDGNKTVLTNWENSTLSEKQIQYAAKDAYGGIELFKAFSCLIMKMGLPRYNLAIHAPNDEQETLEICKITFPVYMCFNEKFDLQELTAKIYNIGHNLDYWNIHYESLDSPNIRTVVVNTFQECEQIVQKIKKDCVNDPVLGINCESTEIATGERKIALLQLATSKGLCALIRLCKLSKIPKELDDLLRDSSIVKITSTENNIDRYLNEGYSLELNNTKDIQFIAQISGFKSMHLRELFKTVFKNDEMVQKVGPNWFKQDLSKKEIKCATQNAYALIKLYRKLQS